jgi:hypothetical protein
MKIKTVFCLLFALFSAATALGKTLPTVEELLLVGARQMNCKITYVGAFNFIGNNQDGKEINFTTSDDSLQFIPADERLVVGDEVMVTYIEAFSPSGSPDKTYALAVEWLNKVERKFLAGKITCYNTPLTYRGANTCYVKELDEVIRFETRDEFDPWMKPGEPVHLKIKAIPAKIGNGYVYQGRIISE